MTQDLKPVLCDHLERWEGGSRGRGRMYKDLWPIHVDMWQKPTQYCKAIILSPFKKFFYRVNSNDNKNKK